jgi:hypothetical protein
VYEQERTGWLQNRSAVLASRVRALLEGEPVDVDRVQRALGYQLRQHHVGLVLWVDGHVTDLDPLRVLGELAAASARAVGSVESPLFVPCDDTTAWAWLALGSDGAPALSELAAVAAKAPAPASMAVGAADRGGGRVPPDAPPSAQRSQP